MRRGSLGSVITRKLPIVDNGDCFFLPLHIGYDSFNVENIPDAGMEEKNMMD